MSDTTANTREEQIFFGYERVGELWTAIKTALANKADLSALNDYATPDAVATAIATALTDYAKNAEVKTAISTALAGYMTANEVAAAIAAAAHITFEAADELPETGKPNVIYLIPNGGASGNSKTEYMWIDGAYEKVGDLEADLSQYWSKAELRAMTAEELQALLV